MLGSQGGQPAGHVPFLSSQAFTRPNVWSPDDASICSRCHFPWNLPSAWTLFQAHRGYFPTGGGRCSGPERPSDRQQRPPATRPGLKATHHRAARWHLGELSNTFKRQVCHPKCRLMLPDPQRCDQWHDNMMCSLAPGLPQG